MKKLLCRLFGHKFDEFHLYEVVCSRCHVCRDYTEEDWIALKRKQEEMRENAVDL